MRQRIDPFPELGARWLCNTAIGGKNAFYSMAVAAGPGVTALWWADGEGRLLLCLEAPDAP